MRYFSPSKLNLFFRVLRKRPDGYHDIASLFQAIDLGDTIELFASPVDRLTCSDPALACDETNLIMKALRLFRTRYECPSLHIHLNKHIPIQSGLGGGSGNAATTLWALNVWTGNKASLQELIDIGAELGSDVPFFFSTGSVYCTGRGEILEQVEIAPFDGVLVKPSYGLSTPKVYGETRVNELPRRDPREALASFSTAVPQYFNDLEPAAFRLEPRLQALQAELLASGYSTVCMTGSGTGLFCLGGPEAKQGIPFRSLNRSLDSWWKSVSLSV